MYELSKTTSQSRNHMNKAVITIILAALAAIVDQVMDDE